MIAMFNQFCRAFESLFAMFENLANAGKNSTEVLEARSKIFLDTETLRNQATLRELKKELSIE